MKLKQTLIGLCCILMLTSLSVNLHAQVTIGSEEKPVDGALLDLKQETKNDGTANSNKGLGLPRVALTAVEALEPCTVTNATNKASHTGLTVYNTTDNSATVGTLKEGVYAWDGNSWQPMGLRNTQGFGPWYQVANPALPSRAVDADSYLNAKAVVGGTTVLGDAALSVYGGTVIDGQATIGYKSAPASAAILDLKTQDANIQNITSDKGGLLLPRVHITDTLNLKPFIEGNVTAKQKSDHAGLTVYEVGGLSEDGNYSLSPSPMIWDGTKWLKLVTNIPSAKMVVAKFFNLLKAQSTRRSNPDNTNEGIRLAFGEEGTAGSGNYYIEIDEAGSYAFAFRIFGTAKIEYTYLDDNSTINFYPRMQTYYLNIMTDNGTIDDESDDHVLDVAELSAPVLRRISTHGFAAQGFTTVLAASDLKVGDRIYFRMSNFTECSPLDLFWNTDNTNAARTSMVYWKL